MTALTERLPEVRLPSAVSKSAMRAMGCETHYANYYVLADSPYRLLGSPLAVTGTDFHAWRAAYIGYLLGEGRSQDRDWARQWLAGAVVTEDARQLILDDLETYAIDPEAVFGVEIFLSMSAQGEPVEMEFGAGEPGRISTDPRAIASGSLDLLEVRGDEATVSDYKSGWASAAVSDYEPPVYAALVFAHFPQVQRVNFRWEFVRLRAEKSASYGREQLPELLDMVIGALARAGDIARRFAGAGRLSVNPWAGLCAFCELRCPLRAAAQSGSLLIPPVQSEDDARQTAAILFASRQIADRAAVALKPWLAERGQMPLNEDFVIELTPRYSSKKPLLTTLELLGYNVESMRGNSPAYDVPVEKLTLGGLSTYAKAKKRTGLPEKLAAVTVRNASNIIRIRRLSEGERLLAGGNEASEQSENADANAAA